MKTFASLLLICSVIACRQIPQAADIIDPKSAEVLSRARYDEADLYKLGWLAGAWKGEEGGNQIQLLFQFHGENMLEVMEFGKPHGANSTFLSWSEGYYYLGENRDWKIVWIGEKDVRFEPARSGRSAMTWTRLSDNTWYRIHHLPSGDQAMRMERTENMQP